MITVSIPEQSGGRAVPRVRRDVAGSPGAAPPPGSILHVLVAGARPARAIRYRRDRLAEYLLAQPSTAELLWLYPASVRAVGFAGGNGVRHPSGLEPVCLPDVRRLAAEASMAQRLVLRPLLRRLAADPTRVRVLWFTRPVYARLLRAPCWDAVVYDCSDFWTNGVQAVGRVARFRARRLEREEAALIRGSDRVFAASVFLAERIRNRFGREVELVENGVDLALFASAPPEPPPDIADLPRPRLGFVGGLKSHKIDFELLHQVAASNPAWSVVLIGPVEGGTDRRGDFARLCDLPNVRWLGPRPAADIPRYLKAMDVGLLPYRDVAYNEGVFPLKFFEYLAAGLPVVGSSLPATATYREEGVYYHTTSESSSFASACQAALGSGDVRERRLALAAGADWRRKFGLMFEQTLSLVEEAGARGRRSR